MSITPEQQRAVEELPPVGAIIDGKYRIESVLGVGGMGAVFAARNERTGKTVALKWMLPAVAQNAEAVARFLREAQAAGRVSHPNVVDVYDVGRHGDSPYLVMEFLHGESLAKRLERGVLPVADAVNVLISVLRGIAAAHAQNVVHRDLKPENIFLCRTPQGAARPPKVVDFGISKLQDDAGDPQLTQTGALIGTPYYLAPEQVQGRGATHLVDIHALGVILYQLLTGRVPYQASNYGALLIAIAVHAPEPLASLRPDLDPALIAVIDRAMAKDPAQRWPSARAFAVALERFGSMRFDEGAGDGFDFSGAGDRARSESVNVAGEVASAPGMTFPLSPTLPSGAGSGATGETPLTTSLDAPIRLPGSRAPIVIALGVVVLLVGGLGFVGFGMLSSAEGGSTSTAAPGTTEGAASVGDVAASPDGATGPGAVAVGEHPALTVGLAALAAGDIPAAFRAFETLPADHPAKARPEVAQVRTLYVASRRAEADRLRGREPDAARAIEMSLLTLTDLHPAVRAELEASLSRSLPAPREHRHRRETPAASANTPAVSPGAAPPDPPAAPSRRAPPSLAPR